MKLESKFDIGLPDDRSVDDGTVNQLNGDFISCLESQLVIKRIPDREMYWIKALSVDPCACSILVLKWMVCRTSFRQFWSGKKQVTMVAHMGCGRVGMEISRQRCRDLAVPTSLIQVAPLGKAAPQASSHNNRESAIRANTATDRGRG